MKPNKPVQQQDWVSQQLAEAGVRASFEQERAAHEFIAQIESVLREKHISKAQLARVLGRSAPSISQALQKGRNLTIKLMCEIASACDHEVHVRLRARDAHGGPIHVEPERT
jgi:antitoxin component HigA of HigAB toxin-antitoxin module